jgi:hypothetical protein
LFVWGSGYVCNLIACITCLLIFSIGVAKNYIQTTLDMKKNLSIMILDKLREFRFFNFDYSTNISIGQAAGMPVPRMYYTNFDHAITEKFHVVLEGWPLEKFCSPSDIQSRTEISVLMKSLESGATRFRKLSSTEFEHWSEKRFNAKAASTTGPDAIDNTSSQHPPPSIPAPSPLVSQENEGVGDSTTLDPDVENVPPLQPSPSRDPGSENLQHLSSMTVPAKRNHTDVIGPSTSQRPLADAFINTGVTSANGATVMVNAKVRKPRADKGKKRGPRAK